MVLLVKHRFPRCTGRNLLKITLVVCHRFALLFFNLAGYLSCCEGSVDARSSASARQQIATSRHAESFRKNFSTFAIINKKTTISTTIDILCSTDRISHCLTAEIFNWKSRDEPCATGFLHHQCNIFNVVEHDQARLNNSKVHGKSLLKYLRFLFSCSRVSTM